MARRKTIQKIANKLCYIYGDTLKEGGTDVKMAEAAYTVMKRNYWLLGRDISVRQYEKWKLKRDPNTRNRHNG